MTDAVKDMKALIERVEGAEEEQSPGLIKEGANVLHDARCVGREAMNVCYRRISAGCPLDATEALKGGLKGEWEWNGFNRHIQRHRESWVWNYTIQDSDGGSLFSTAPTEPLARLSAVLRAFLYEMEARDD